MPLPGCTGRCGCGRKGRSVSSCTPACRLPRWAWLPLWALLLLAGSATASETIAGRFAPKLGEGRPRVQWTEMNPANHRGPCSDGGWRVGATPEACRAMGMATRSFAAGPNYQSPGVVIGRQTLVAGSTVLTSRPHIELNTGLQGVYLARENGEWFRIEVELIGAAVRYQVAEGRNPRARASDSGECRTSDVGSFGHAGPRSWSNLYVLASATGPALCLPQPITGIGGEWDNVVPGDEIDASVELTALTFRMTAPGLAGVGNGIYRGTRRIQVGRTGDIDVGADGATTLEVEFEVEVVNQVVVSFGDGAASAQVTLAPQGGWRANPAPQRLLQEVPLRFGSTVPLSIRLRCGLYAGERCAIAPAGAGPAPVPIDLSVNLAGYARYEGGPVHYARIPAEASSGPPLVVEPDRSMGAQLSPHARLRVETDAEATAELLRHPGTHYQGSVTVIFEPWQR